MSRLLIVDDDQVTLNFLTALLRKHGHAVETARTGKEGLIEAWQHRPNLIILDLSLPDIGGLEVLRRLRADHRSATIPVIAFTAHANPEEKLAGLETGLDSYVVKKVGADKELIEQIDELLRRPAESRRSTTPLRRAKTICFMSAKGGTGTSSLCINTAQAIAAHSPAARIVVADLVLPIGSIALLLGTPLDRTVVDITQLPPDQIKNDEIAKYLHSLPQWGFKALAGSPDPERAQQLRLASLRPLIAALEADQDYLVVDVGRTLSPISLPLIQEAHALALVLTADAATVNLTQRVIKYLRDKDVQDKQLYLILNRPVRIENEMNRASVEEALGASIAVGVPHVGGDLALASSLHQPYATRFPTTTASYTFKRIATELVEKCRIN